MGGPTTALFTFWVQAERPDGFVKTSLQMKGLSKQDMLDSADLKQLYPNEPAMWGDFPEAHIEIKSF